MFLRVVSFGQRIIYGGDLLNSTWEQFRTHYLEIQLQRLGVCFKAKVKTQSIAMKPSGYSLYSSLEFIPSCHKQPHGAVVIVYKKPILLLE